MLGSFGISKAWWDDKPQEQEPEVKAYADYYQIVNEAESAVKQALQVVNDAVTKLTDDSMENGDSQSGNAAKNLKQISSQLQFCMKLFRQKI